MSPRPIHFLALFALAGLAVAFGFAAFAFVAMISTPPSLRGVNQRLHSVGHHDDREAPIDQEW